MYQFPSSADQALWTTLVEDPATTYEPRVLISGTYYTKTTLISIQVNRQIFSGSQPSVGGCISSELTLSMLKPSSTIPRMAEIRVYVRAVNGSTFSAWMPQGVFFIDTRETTKNDDGVDVLSFHAYDAMLKAEADYPNTTDEWPMTDIDVIKEIAMTMGLQASVSSTDGIDTRTITAVANGYQIGLPAGQTMREVLSNIAAMYGGNWIMNYDGQLLLIKIADLPPETNYLVTITGDPITFGGDRIIV